MRSSRTDQGPVLPPKNLWPEDFDAALAERNGFGARPRPSRKEQIVTGMKLFVVAGTVMLALWLMDYVLTR